MRSHLVNFLQSVFRSNLVSKISIVSCVINTQINNAILFTGQPFEQSSSSQHGVVVAGHIGDRRTQNTLALFALEQIEIAFQFHLHLLIKRPMGGVRTAEGAYLYATINETLRNASCKTFHSFECHFDFPLILLESHDCGNDEIQNSTADSGKNANGNIIDAKFLCPLNICLCGNSSSFDNGEAIFDSDSCGKVVSNHCTINFSTLQRSETPKY